VFLQATLSRNPGLVDAAIELHHSGQIGPNTYVIDLDTVADNARLLAREAGQFGVRLHGMTKQHGRNPFVAKAAIEAGIDDIVAVDVPEARILHRHGLPIGHIGHLVQVPTRDTPEVVAMKPGVVTVFSIDAARRLAEAAVAAGNSQPILLRVWKPGDFIYPGQEGGFRVSELAGAAEKILALPAVRIVGVTSFPCLLADESGIHETGNLDSVQMSARILRDECGLELSEINVPGVTSVTTLPIVAARGGTHAEPGSSLTGNTPLNSRGSEPERPGMVYVTEVSATDGDLAYCFGGGFYARSRLRQALHVGRDGDRRAVDATPLPPEVIDYYGTVRLGHRGRVVVGDTLVFAFRSQVFVSRSQVAIVAGVAYGEAHVLGLFDAQGNLLAEDQLPIDAGVARELVEDRWGAWLGRRKAVVQGGSV